MNTATVCECCQDPESGTPQFHDQEIDAVVCSECARNLAIASKHLAENRISGAFTGPCPDNDPASPEA